MSESKSIVYVTGDATRPQRAGNKVIIHVCNDLGKWGKGFVLSLSRRFGSGKGTPEGVYRSAAGYTLGDTQFVQVKDDLWVCNMVAQKGIDRKYGVPPIRYTALAYCLERVYFWCKEHNATVHAPRFGAGLAGGKWSTIEESIYAELADKGVEVTIYDLQDNSP